MTRASHGTPHGAGKFEFLVVVALFGVLAMALLDRLVELERTAERTEVDLTERNMRVGLQLAIGEDLMRGREDRLPALLETNPVSFLGRLPRGYLGDGGAPDGPGTWRFDAERRILAYRPRQPEAFGGRTELSWKMASQGSLGGRIVGIRLERLPDRRLPLK